VAEAKTIHVIEDDTALRTAYSAALSQLGYQTKTASDGLKGQELLKSDRPDLILLDMLMPNLDGMGYLESLRADPANADIKVVVVSNFESMPEVEGLHVAKYLSKMENPPEAVAAAVDKILQAS
jgi:CheY-like chemotaxis protein